jgi:hypothetical protein
MNKSKLLERLRGCEPVLERSGITLERIAITVGEIEKLDGVGVSKKVKWLRRVEVACKYEDEHYRDFTPKGWANLAILSPGNEDVKKLKTYRKDVRVAFKS